MTAGHLFDQLTRLYGDSCVPDRWWPLTHQTEPPRWVRVCHAALSVNSTWPLIVRGADSLARRGLLTAAAVVGADVDSMGAAIEGGLGRTKARRWRAICELAVTFGSEAEFLVRVARAQLLALPWVREETADRILLYSCGRPVFPVDRHVRAVFDAAGLLPAAAADADYKEIVQQTLGDDVGAYARLYAACQIESAGIRRRR